MRLFDPFRNKYSNYFNVSCLIDSGSPINLISKGLVPKSTLLEDLLPSKYVGIENCNMKTYGTISCQIKFKNIIKTIELLVVPNDDIQVPIIVGRDC